MLMAIAFLIPKKALIKRHKPMIKEATNPGPPFTYAKVFKRSENLILVRTTKKPIYAKIVEYKKAIKSTTVGSLDTKPNKSCSLLGNSYIANGSSGQTNKKIL